MNATFQRGRDFVIRRARPIDRARWAFFFEGAPAASVLDALAAFQNPDGGFGHGLEADFWNPQSSPMQTWAATEILLDLGLTDAGHPVVEGVLRYLAGFDGHRWPRTIPSNNDHPHAPWWTHADQDPSEVGYNPTAALAGFALRFAAVGSPLHDKAGQVAGEALSLLLRTPSVEVHELSCFQRLYQAVLLVQPAPGIDLGKVDAVLQSQMNAALTRDTSQWETGYVCRPSRFIRSPDDPLFPGNADLVRAEAAFLRRTQHDDGTWPVNWAWSSYPEEWAVAREWWKGTIILENLRFLKAFDNL